MLCSPSAFAHSVSAVPVDADRKDPRYIRYSFAQLPGQSSVGEYDGLRGVPFPPAVAAIYEESRGEGFGLVSLPSLSASSLELVRVAEGERVLSLVEAAQHSGYSKAHLARLVQDGKLTTLRPPGSRGRLSFRQADLPRKPGSRHRSSAGVHELASRLLRGKERHHGRS